MPRYSLLVLAAVIIVLLGFFGCKKKAPPKIAPQSTPNVVQESNAPAHEINDNEAPELVLPKTFIRSFDKRGLPVFVQVGWAGEDRSEYHSFPKYDVMTTIIPGVAGDRIDVLKHHELRADTLVITEADSLVLSVGFMGSWFDELIDEYLVVSISTDPGVNPLWIYDLKTAKRTCTLYCNTPRSWNGYLVTAWFPSDSLVTDDNCPEAKEWRSHGQDVRMEEKRELDIRTCLMRKLGEFRCVTYE